MAQPVSTPTATTVRALRDNHGALAGGTTGLLIGGPLGALLGTALGHAYDRTRRALFAVEDAFEDIAAIDARRPAPTPTTSYNRASEAAFTIGIIALGAKLARLNRKLDRDTIERFRAAFRLPPSDIPMIRKMFEQALFDAVGHKPYADQLASLFAARPDMLEALLLGLVRFAKVENDGLTPAVLDYLDALALRFAISPAKLDNILQGEGITRESVISQSVYTAPQSPFEVLGLTRSAPEIVIKQAYRRLIKECHPDGLAERISDGNAALAISPELLADANDRMAAINAAYAEIKKQRGWN